MRRSRCNSVRSKRTPTLYPMRFDGSSAPSSANENMLGSSFGFGLSGFLATVCCLLLLTASLYGDSELSMSSLSGYWYGEDAKIEHNILQQWVTERTEEGAYEVVFRYTYRSSGEVEHIHEIGTWWLDGDTIYFKQPDEEDNADGYEIVSFDGIQLIYQLITDADDFTYDQPGRAYQIRKLPPEKGRTMLQEYRDGLSAGDVES